MNRNYLISGVLAVVAVLIIGGYLLFSNERSQIRDDVLPPVQNPQASSGQNVLPESTQEGRVTGTEVTFTVEGSPFKFAPNQLKVSRGDIVKITFINVSGIHDFVLPKFDVATAQLSAGKQETVEFVADSSGEFEFYCSVGNHREMGMKGTLVVE